MKKFDPASMPETTSPTVRALRTFVERTIENEVENALAAHGEDTAVVVEKYLRAAVLRIFHKNPDVHSVVKGDIFVFDTAIQTLFAISPEPISDAKEEQ